MKWKVEGILLSLLLLLLPIISMAETEFLDAADSRQSYAHIVAMLNQNAAGGLIAPYSEQVTPYTLVLIRMWEGQPDFGSYAPELVAVGPQNCYMAAFADDQIDGGAVVLHVEPVADIFAGAVDWQAFISQRSGDHQRDQFFRKMLRTIVV